MKKSFLFTKTRHSQIMQNPMRGAVKNIIAIAVFDVDEERRRAEKAKEEFFHAWDELKRKVSNSFSIDFDASERLPKWNWNIFGKIVVVDLNIYKDDLRYIGIMLVLVCFVIALFVVFGD